MNEKLRSHALSIFQAALDAADPRAACRNWAEKNWRAPAGRTYVIGAGKAGAAMAQGLEDALAGHIDSGLINVKYGHTAPLQRIELNECGHPVPDEAGVRGAARIAEIAENATGKDLIFCLISGGASALLPYPVDGITLAQKQEVTRQLLACGANIHEINAVRKHLSRIKGGQLARLAHPARIVTLILSDVIGDNLDVIGSGPTAPDSSTIADAIGVLRKYKIETDTIAAMRETPKPGDPAFQGVENIIVGGNGLALAAAVQKARALGFHTLLLASTIEGETRDVARMHAAIAREVVTTGNPISRPACIISGGETTVTLRGTGKGGRNQEFALAAAIDIAGLPNTLVMSCGTDGTDGPTDAAGAMADGSTVDDMDAARVALDNNDAYRFFQPRDGLVITGPTHTNVMDIHVMLID